ncbi:NAD-dependent succinate-semialdehyde dehydrogenase [Sphingobium lignivorans]|uniref:Succinate-semialdehyde dehydrogenase/glutarate-semialdehyde dehydrogenase n=1 Tax=Sphingobium lignivorans TaxID=2735886 RepID=A0ABR6NLZ0_9SPHN|nr:NAD-dependent succinate-semialdehyde dehydrogenase [Sphingobium lignivorans]MBB5987533.1 succinate-semialdehyde dehydrogenase/glutarate-semialdehyde dehydrogenase [Sphingobium lignivorans]
MYTDSQLFIDGEWRAGADGLVLPVVNPADGLRIGSVAKAERADLDRAADAAMRGFALWRDTPAHSRAETLRSAAVILRRDAEMSARLMSLEQGKPVAEALGEVLRGAEFIDWMAGEAQRAYGRVIPARGAGVLQLVTREPVGPVAAFTPWNFPINQAVRKIAGALAAGCSIIIKGPEETPASCAALVRAFEEAGTPAGVINLVFGTPAEISEYLIPHPAIRKVSFTGSTVVGKHLAALAGLHMKPVTMELGGHAPVIVCADADIPAAAQALAAFKTRTSGQSCISPTRLLIEAPVYGRFVDALLAAFEGVKMGDGGDPATTMGPMANPRRVDALEALVEDALAKGARLHIGGKRRGEAGNFFPPTVLAEAPVTSRIMNEEPFGPLLTVQPFETLESAITEANRLPYGLAAYVFTGSPAKARHLYSRIECGMLSVNHFGLGSAETPFGGVRDSGFGVEGGAEAIEPYLQTRFYTSLERFE